MGITSLTTSLLSLKENVDALNEYTRVPVSQLFDTFIVPLDELGNILVQVKHNMKANPGLQLPDDPDQNYLSYYSVI